MNVGLRFCGKIITPLWVVILALLMVSCGFHLRGQISEVSDTVHSIAIINQASHEWESLLRTPFNNAHVIITEPSVAQYTIFIQHEETKSNLVGVSSSATPRQYELSYQVTFSVQLKRGDDFIAPSTIIIKRPLTINNDSILGSHDEEEILLREMKRIAAMQMIDRLIHQAKSSSKMSKLHSHEASFHE